MADIEAINDIASLQTEVLERDSHGVPLVLWRE
jgi:hypothetical protein